VIFLRNAFAQESFRGVAVVEVVRERDTSELLSLVGKKGEVPPQVLPSIAAASQAAAHAATLPEVVITIFIHPFPCPFPIPPLFILPCL
jgi:hypothetical protein